MLISDARKAQFEDVQHPCSDGPGMGMMTQEQMTNGAMRTHLWSHVVGRANLVIQLLPWQAEGTGAGNR